MRNIHASLAILNVAAWTALVYMIAENQDARHP